jgi:hypothetical protein
MKTKYILIMAILLAFLMTPVMAGTKYMSGSPELSASISGVNEFSPGKEVPMTVLVQNKGLNEIKMVQSSIASPGDLPNTAKLLTVRLDSGQAPLKVKSDPQMVGDIQGGSAVPVTFVIRVDTNAPPGEYLLPLTMNYTYLFDAEQTGMDAITFRYKEITGTFLLPVRIKSLVSLEIQNATPEHLNVGTEGYLNLDLRNKGYQTGKNAVIRVVKDSTSPVVPVDSSVYIGEFPPNGTVHARYKVFVSPDADAKSYPVNVVAVYENNEGDTITSDPVTIGVPVAGKVDFAIVSPAKTVYPGTKSVIDIVYKNTGAATVYSAQARISMVDPFTSNDDVSFLGDLKPGDQATAHFEVSVDKAATLKEYGLDSEIRYRDALDNSRISSTMKVKIDVTGRSGINAIVSNPILMSIIIAGVIGGIYYLFFYRKGKNKAD